MVHSSGRLNRPPLHPCIGVDSMEQRPGTNMSLCSRTSSQWPLVYPVPDQKAIRLARLLVDEVVPVAEAFLPDRGTNLLSHLIKLLEIRKLNTTAYHPQCDGMVEWFNRTLKTILRKCAARFGAQWDRYLPGVLWAFHR